MLVNGIPSRPFQAKKVLRQGDPLSPFMFALSMEYLSRCLNELKKSHEFNFHPKCERLNITHLMFADDLLMFCRADKSSLDYMVNAFKKFSEASGLSASQEKSNIYFCGVNEDTARELADSVQMQMGELPFRYLGVPLTSKKLTNAQCKPLVEKITNRAQTWMANLLSYAGRLQLVKSILSSMQNCWAHIFPLSKKIIQVVERVCRRFLWTGKTEHSKKAPIAWATIQMPKSGGGWNVINMLHWIKLLCSNCCGQLNLKGTRCG